MHTSKPSSAVDPRCTCLLLRQAARVVTQLYDEHLRPAGLRTSQFSLLANLRHDAGLSMGKLAARLTMDRTTLTRNLRPLTDAGWVASRPDPDDRRRTRLALTPAGRVVLRAAVPRWREAQRALRERVGDGTVLALHASIDGTLEHLE
ncbi:MAG: MarR family winged helix-turn-helix transcriptional regulator [Burkholderiales bacterium]